jgi:hypothetical protein
MTASPASPITLDDGDVVSPRAMESDPSRLTSFPQLTAPALATFAGKLIQSAPQDATDPELEALRRVEDDAEILLARLAQNVQPSTQASVRKPLDRLVVLMNASHDRTRALAELDEESPLVDAARLVSARVFPTRVGFGQLSAWDVVTEVEIRMAILEAPEVRQAFDRVVGEPVRPWISEALLDLKRAVGTAPAKKSKKSSPFAPKPLADVAGAMAELRISIVSYAQRIVGLHDPRSATSVARMERALAAIDEVKREWKPSQKKNGETAPDAVPFAIPAELAHENGATTTART